MGKTIYDMRLTDDERDMLTKLIAEGKEDDRTILRSRILLLCDLNKNPKISNVKMADMLGTTDTTVQTVKTEFGKYGLERAVFRKPRTKTLCTEEAVQQIVALSKERPPEGKRKWSLSMLCKEAEKRGYAKSISRNTMMLLMHEHNPDYAVMPEEGSRHT